ncbi:MAG: hypothetical protein Q8O54_08355, partial [Brevundimonas sp.]|nr:hypothetical protein [Brevundimonas sp.]
MGRLLVCSFIRTYDVGDRLARLFGLGAGHLAATEGLAVDFIAHFHARDRLAHQLDHLLGLRLFSEVQAAYTVSHRGIVLLGDVLGLERIVGGHSPGRELHGPQCG